MVHAYKVEKSDSAVSFPDYFKHCGGMTTDGGPIFSTATEECIGISIAKQFGNNTSIPSACLNLLLPRLLSERGKLEHGALGIYMVKEKNPNEIVAIYPGSAAKKAGLKENDFLLAIDGEQITKWGDSQRIFQLKRPGDKVTIIYRRGNEMKVAEATLDKLDD